MKKLVLFMALAGTVAFTSCSKDDDDKKCTECEVIGIKMNLCDNGDGTVTATIAGQTDTISGEELGGLTPAEYISSTCAASGLFGN